MHPVAVIGAGLAGLSAAVELTLRGIPVTVFEQKPHAGGRAYSFVDEESGEIIDNGQHAMIGGYEATLRFLDTIGSTRHLWRQQRPSLTFHHPEKGFREFSLPSLPSPFHLAAGIVTTRLFSFSDKMHLLKAGKALLRLDSDERALEGLTTDRWLRSIGQTDETIRSFWEPLVVAIMNERGGNASALLFARCLHRAFIESEKNATLLLPSVGLSELFADPACALIEHAGGRVRLHSRVTGIITEGAIAKRIRCSDGSTEEVSSIIVAVPPWSIGSLHTDLEDHAAAFKSSPIVSIHFWFDEAFMDIPLVGIIGRTVQWIFDRRKIAERNRDGGHISCVVSSATEIVDRSNDEILAIAEDDLYAVFGRNTPPPRRGVVIRERKATFSPDPFVEKHRPHTKTAISNLFLAGDWTNTGLPGTIEGAVISGKKAADLVRA